MDDETQRAALRLQERAEKAEQSTQGVESTLTPHYRLSLAECIYQVLKIMKVLNNLKKLS